MVYPVDLPADSDTDLTSASDQYLSSLETNPQIYETSQALKVEIKPSNIQRLQVFEDGCTLLALHPPGVPMQVVALYLHEKWWSTEDVLRTSSKSRDGLISVESVVERVMVFLLSQVVERTAEDETLFSLHPRTESCKLLWIDGQAVAFYSVKHKGSLCDGWSGQGYLLPVLDTVLVRKSWRRRGLGLQMLEDFCRSFSTEQFLGISSPLSHNMVAVCRRFLQQHEEHQERLYEVEAPGGWSQRRNIWLSIQLGHFSACNEEERRGEEDKVEEHVPKSVETHQSEDDDSPLKASHIPSDVNIPMVISSSEEQIKSCDLCQEGRSPSSIMSGTRCGPVVHDNDLDSGPPTTSPQSPNTEQTRQSKPSTSAEDDGGKPDGAEKQRGPKRMRRT